MKFQYYWDRDLFEALLRYRMRPFLADIIAAYNEDSTMGSPADIQKLMQRMQRSSTLTDRAVNTGASGESIMNDFEATLNRMDDHFGKIKEYNKQLGAMMEVTGNGGPPLADAFQPASPPAGTVSASTAPFDHGTGDPLKH
jgi:hypothetical protein